MATWNYWKKIPYRYLLFSIFILFIFSCILSILPLNSDNCNCYEKTYRSMKVSDYVVKRNKISQNKLAVLVPFRDRFEELLQFAPHMKQFLDKQNIDYHIFILHQVDKFRFNRASLINVGFIFVKNDYDYIAMHDIDLLPLNDNLSYGFPDNGPFHISSPELHPRYHYPTFIGGILLVSRKHYLAVNGMSNKYWGWGLEDDEFYVRLKEANLKVYRPQNVLTGSQNTFKHIHDKNTRKRDTIKCFNQREITRKRDRQTGLNNVSYKIEQVINVTISDVPLTVLNIALNCDKTLTPWCDCTKTNEKKTP
ncbi:beta-1,4-galactosyltransferase 7 isoform X1 [Microplitis mediator]|uniref:beta-1,4-galactosyltransferase 7 isoform X1 n=1 Tax=Microplitis mediator TaxID=375433 RepID=UPI002555905D|nr:beta-1,4-galactosyltransferase 7 isoform X1 [Microplitis mediator]XP_057323679.1 beta-1,4-galactosyltransferase 7 isoform X1 [Microplitis mediator]